MKAKVEVAHRTISVWAYLLLINKHISDLGLIIPPYKEITKIRINIFCPCCIAEIPRLLNQTVIIYQGCTQDKLLNFFKH